SAMASGTGSGSTTLVSARTGERVTNSTRAAAQTARTGERARAIICCRFDLNAPSLPLSPAGHIRRTFFFGAAPKVAPHCRLHTSQALAAMEVEIYGWLTIAISDLRQG